MIDNTKAAVDKGEIIRKNGHIQFVKKGTGGKSDDVLMATSPDFAVLGNSYDPEWGLQYKEIGKELYNKYGTKKYLSNDRVSNTSQRLNEQNMNSAFETLLQRQEQTNQMTGHGQQSFKDTADTQYQQNAYGGQVPRYAMGHSGYAWQSPFVDAGLTAGGVGATALGSYLQDQGDAEGNAAKKNIGRALNVAGVAAPTVGLGNLIGGHLYDRFSSDPLKAYRRNSNVYKYMGDKEKSQSLYDYLQHRSTRPEGEAATPQANADWSSENRKMIANEVRKMGDMGLSEADQNMIWNNQSAAFDAMANARTAVVADGGTVPRYASGSTGWGDWMSKNPWKTAGLGLLGVGGAAAGAYGLKRLADYLSKRNKGLTVNVPPAPTPSSLQPQVATPPAQDPLDNIDLPRSQTVGLLPGQAEAQAQPLNLPPVEKYTPPPIVTFDPASQPKMQPMYRSKYSDRYSPKILDPNAPVRMPNPNLDTNWKSLSERNDNLDDMTNEEYRRLKYGNTGISSGRLHSGKDVDMLHNVNAPFFSQQGTYIDYLPKEQQQVAWDALPEPPDQGYRNLQAEDAQNFPRDLFNNRRGIEGMTAHHLADTFQAPVGADMGNIKAGDAFKALQGNIDAPRLAREAIDTGAMQNLANSAFGSFGLADGGQVRRYADGGEEEEEGRGMRWPAAVALGLAGTVPAVLGGRYLYNRFHKPKVIQAPANATPVAPLVNAAPPAAQLAQRTRVADREPALKEKIYPQPVVAPDAPGAILKTQSGAARSAVPPGSKTYANALVQTGGANTPDAFPPLKVGKQISAPTGFRLQTGGKAKAPSEIFGDVPRKHITSLQDPQSIADLKTRQASYAQALEETDFEQQQGNMVPPPTIGDFEKHPGEFKYFDDNKGKLQDAIDYFQRNDVQLNPEGGWNQSGPTDVAQNQALPPDFPVGRKNTFDYLPGASAGKQENFATGQEGLAQPAAERPTLSMQLTPGTNFEKQLFTGTTQNDLKKVPADMRDMFKDQRSFDRTANKWGAYAQEYNDRMGQGALNDQKAADALAKKHGFTPKQVQYFHQELSKQDSPLWRIEQTYADRDNNPINPIEQADIDQAKMMISNEAAQQQAQQVLNQPDVQQALQAQVPPQAAPQAPPQAQVPPQVAQQIAQAAPQAARQVAQAAPQAAPGLGDFLASFLQADKSNVLGHAYGGQVPRFPLGGSPGGGYQPDTTDPWNSGDAGGEAAPNDAVNSMLMQQLGADGRPAMMAGGIRAILDLLMRDKGIKQIAKPNFVSPVTNPYADAIAERLRMNRPDLSKYRSEAEREHSIAMQKIGRQSSHAMRAMMEATANHDYTASMMDAEKKADELNLQRDAEYARIMGGIGESEASVRNDALRYNAQEQSRVDDLNARTDANLSKYKEYRRVKDMEDVDALVRFGMHEDEYSGGKYSSMLGSGVKGAKKGITKATKKANDAFRKFKNSQVGKELGEVLMNNKYYKRFAPQRGTNYSIHIDPNFD